LKRKMTFLALLFILLLMLVYSYFYTGLTYTELNQYDINSGLIQTYSLKGNMLESKISSLSKNEINKIIAEYNGLKEVLKQEALPNTSPSRAISFNLDISKEIRIHLYSDKTFLILEQFGRKAIYKVPHAFNIKLQE
jgi:hypothetical protein